MVSCIQYLLMYISVRSKCWFLFSGCLECQDKVSEIGILVSKVSNLETMLEKKSASFKDAEKSFNDKKQLDAKLEAKLKEITVAYTDVQRKLKDEKHANENDMETRY